jgi:DNA topoisomerase-2
LFFNRKKADERKQWLSNYDPESYIDHTLDWIRYSEFVDKEMIHYAVDSNMRAIPSVMDGLKPGQRKILFACFKRNLRAEIKVA